MAGWDEIVIRAGAVAAASAVLVKSTITMLRGGKRGWAEAVAHQVDPKIEKVREELAELRAAGLARFDSIDAAIGKPNGKGNLVEMMERVLVEVESHGLRLEALEHKKKQADEIDRLAREGKVPRRSTDPEGRKP